MGGKLNASTSVLMDVTNSTAGGKRITPKITTDAMVKIMRLILEVKNLFIILPKPLVRKYPWCG